jgi:hypothetical protein
MHQASKAKEAGNTVTVTTETGKTEDTKEANVTIGADQMGEGVETKEGMT